MATAHPAKRSRRAAPPGPARFYGASFPSSPGNVEGIVQLVMPAIAERTNLGPQMPAIELALREALANAILHGNGGNRRKRVRVECYQQPDGVLVLVVRDSGRGFNAAETKDPTHPDNIFRDHGRGIFLIRHFMDDVEFRRGGREIRMKKRLD